MVASGIWPENLTMAQLNAEDQTEVRFDNGRILDGDKFIGITYRLLITLHS